MQEQFKKAFIGEICKKYLENVGDFELQYNKLLARQELIAKGVDETDADNLISSYLDSEKYKKTHQVKKYYIVEICKKHLENVENFDLECNKLLARQELIAKGVNKTDADNLISSYLDSEKYRKSHTNPSVYGFIAFSFFGYGLFVWIHYLVENKPIDLFYIVSIFISVVSILFILRSISKFHWSGFLGQKTWNWLDLLIVPFLLSVTAFYLDVQIDNRQRTIANTRTEQELLVTYFEQVKDLLLNNDYSSNNSQNHDLNELTSGEVIESLTITVLQRLSKERKTLILKFLRESGLVTFDKGSHCSSFKGQDSKTFISLNGADFSGADFSGLDLRCVNLRGSKLFDVNFTKSDLRDADLDSIKINSKTKFNRANLQNTNFGGTINTINNDLVNYLKLTRSLRYLRNTKCDKSELLRENYSNLNFSNVDLSELHFCGAIFENSTFRETNFENTQFTNTEFINSEFEKTNFKKVVFNGSSIKNSTYKSPNLLGAKINDTKGNNSHLPAYFNEFINISSKKISFVPREVCTEIFKRKEVTYPILSNEQCDGFKNKIKYLKVEEFNQQDLDKEKYHIDKLDMKNLDLKFVDLSGADLSGADLSGADLSGADLSGADLSGADLSGADLTFADLSGSTLNKTKFIESILIRTKLVGIQIDESAVFENAKLMYSVFYSEGEEESKIKNSIFFGANLSCADLSNADLSGSTFDSADLRKTNITGSNLARTSFNSSITNGLIRDNIDKQASKNIDVQGIDRKTELDDNLCEEDSK